MESLAATVAVIMSTILFSAPISLALSWSRTQQATAHNKFLNILRRSIGSFFAIIGILFSANLIFSGVPITASLIALACANLNILAIRNEYFRHIR